MRYPAEFPSFIIVVLALMVSPLSCSDPLIDPFQNDSMYFTVYGYLDESSSSQALRLIPVSRRNATILDPTGTNSTIDAVVTTTDLLSGQVTNRNHNLQQLDDGTYAHIYRASMNVRAGGRYRLEIIRNDGKMTSAETHVPSFSSRRVRVGNRYANSRGSVVQDLVLPDVPSPWDIQVIYRSPFPIYLPYGRVGNADGQNDWRFTVQINDDIKRLASLLEISPSDVGWSSMGVQIQILDDQWDPPLDIFDPEILAQPYALSNVENGYGFFGSVSLLQDVWPSTR